jgi:hypothetical protein
MMVEPFSPLRWTLGALAALALAGSAQAQIASPIPDALRAAVVPAVSRPGPELSALRTDAASPFAEAHALKTAGIARTALDRRFAPDDVTGSAGFLCGVPAGVEKSGGAAATGYDPEGRFLGAKLSYAFH